MNVIDNPSGARAIGLSGRGTWMRLAEGLFGVRIARDLSMRVALDADCRMLAARMMGGAVRTRQMGAAVRARARVGARCDDERGDDDPGREWETHPAKPIRFANYCARVMPRRYPDHWQYWFCPYTRAVKPLTVGVISMAEK